MGVLHNKTKFLYTTYKNIYYKVDKAVSIKLRWGCFITLSTQSSLLLTLLCTVKCYCCNITQTLLCKLSCCLAHKRHKEK